MREVDLGLDFFFAAQGARRFCRLRRRIGRAAQMGPHFFGFVLLK
jgi:hypothetical protein